jgi:polar amino acid transport system substrate-binding protein
MSATYRNGERNDLMSEQKHSKQLRIFLAVALAVLTGFAIPAFGQDAPAPTTSPAPNAQSSPQNPAQQSSEKQQVVPPARLSPEDSVAPRTNVDTLAEIKKSGKLRVGVSMIIPWAMHDKDGNLIGFEVDVAKKMARDLGVEVEFYPDEFHYLIPDLLDNRFDLIISGFSISTNRAMQVNFSAPYNYTDLSLAANRKLAGGFKELSEFNKSTVTIGVLDTSTAVDIASNAFPNAQLKTYAEDSDLFNDLLEDKLYAAVADSPRPQIVAKLFPEEVDVPSSKALATFPAAFAVRRGDMDFINYLNSWIEARTVNKWLERRRNYWFASMDWADRL